MFFPYLTTAFKPRLQSGERFFKELLTNNLTTALKMRLQVKIIMR